MLILIKKFLFVGPSMHYYKNSHNKLLIQDSSVNYSHIYEAYQRYIFT